MKISEGKQRFALRKLSIGTVSVLVGVLALGFSVDSRVQADSNVQEPTVVQTTPQVQNNLQQSSDKEANEAAAPAQQAPAQQNNQEADQQASAQQNNQAATQPVAASQNINDQQASDPVTESKTISRVITDIQNVKGRTDNTVLHINRIVYTTNFQRTKTTNADGSFTYSAWKGTSAKAEYQHQVQAADNSWVYATDKVVDLTPDENGNYVIPAYTPKGIPQNVLKPGYIYKPIVNYTTGKNGDGSYQWVMNKDLNGSVPAMVINPNSSVDSLVEVEYLAGFTLDSNWRYDREVFDQNPTTGAFDYTEQATKIMSFVYNEDARNHDQDQTTFDGDSVAAYAPKYESAKYHAHIMKLNDATGKYELLPNVKSLSAMSFKDFNKDVLSHDSDFKEGNYFNHWNETYEIYYTMDSQEDKTVTETIHYNFADGTKAHDDSVQEVTLNRANQVLPYGKHSVMSEGQWNTGTFNEVQSPAIKGYTPDIKTVEKVTVDSNTGNIEKTVTYTKNAPIQNVENHKVTETIHYVYKNGKTALPDTVKTVSVSRTNSTDPVTGEVTYGQWSQATIPEVDVPLIDGYTADTDSIPAVSVDGSTGDITKTVVYTAVLPVIPDNPTNPNNPTTPSNPEQPSNPSNPSQPLNPSNPTTPTNTPNTPETPATPQTPATPDTTVKSENPANDQPAQVAETAEAQPAVKANQQEQKLPQTGNNTNILSLIGFALAAVLGAFGIDTKREKN